MLKRQLAWAFVLSFTIIIVLLLSYGCDFFPNDEDAPSNVVRIRDNSFDPPVINVDAGQRIEWRHEGSNPHTVTSGSPVSDPGSIFDSGNLNGGSDFSFTFTNRGDFAYFCRIHGASMTGLVRVR
jgi:plastocyanin